jgi:RHS repeat-associated protein
VASETTTYLYDEFGSLAQVNLPNGDVITYQMDGSNRRVSKFINGNPAWGLVYQDQLNPVARTNPDGSLEAVFVYGSKINVPEYMIKNGINYKFVTDQVGSVRFVVNADTGAIAQELDYSSFGEVLRDTNPGFQPFGFAGGIYDHQTKLVRFGARDYDGQVGRWVSKDPILFEGGQANLYSYVYNEPLNVIDPEGTRAVGGAVVLVGVGLGVWALYKICTEKTCAQKLTQRLQDSLPDQLKDFFPKPSGAPPINLQPPFNGFDLSQNNRRQCGG